jgi:hypothetical protein
MRYLNAAAARLERLTGLPGRFILPVAFGGLALQVAVVGMYWDIAYHVDVGRDEGLLTMPHNLIVIGLQGLVVAALMNGLIDGPRAQGERKLGPFSFAPGGLQMLFCGSIALLGFPLDALWHALFGEDVTLWGPTHLFMIGGASFSTLGLWMLLRQAWEIGEPRKRIRTAQVRVAGGLLIGLSTFQAEFDFGVPQFQLLFQPVLIALAAGMGLVIARRLLGPGGALKALVLFFVIRGGLALFVGPVLGYTTPHFPLYIAEAIIVELAALALIKRSEPLFALVAGLGIGTVGFAAEYGWSHAWMPHPWTASMLPEALLLATVAAVAAALVGLRIAQALRLPGERVVTPLPRPAFAFAAVALLVALAIPLPRTGGDGTRAEVTPVPAGDGRANLAVQLRPADAAKDAEWFEVMSWQGRSKREITQLREVGPGRYETERPVPAAGPDWKTTLRLGKGSNLAAIPVYLPASPPSGRPAEELVRRDQAFGSETFLLQREATGGEPWVETLAYSMLAGIVALWLALTAWSVLLVERPRRGSALPPGLPARA